MDRADKPPLSSLSGQLRLGLMEEDAKEAVWEDLLAFSRGLFFYLYRRVYGILRFFAGFLLSGFTLTDHFKFWLSRKFVRRKGQLSFPFAHVTLIGVSLSLIFVTASLGDFIFEDADVSESQDGLFVLESTPELVTEESELLSTKVRTYEVQEGDTLYSIAQQFRMTVDAISLANNLPSYYEDGELKYKLKIGREITIPATEGVKYTIRSGDTISSIANKFGSNPQSIVEFNYLFSPYKLAVGEEIIVPVSTGQGQLLGGLTSPSGICGGLTLEWPTTRHDLIGSYTYSHRAIDLPADFDTLFAVAGGEVVAVGANPETCLSFGKECNYGYGGFVFVNIGGGYQVRYGHISAALVSVGSTVEKGDRVAVSGESGLAYGPHLHFELLCNGVKINPLPYFK